MPYRSRLFARNAVSLRPKSALFRRNMGSTRRAAVKRGINSAYPHPAPSRSPVNSNTIKSKSFLPFLFPAINNVAQVGFPMDTVGRGTTDNERLGHKWRNVALHLKGRYHGAPGPNNSWAGYYVVWDQQPNLATAVWSDVFSGEGVYAYPQLSTEDRFKILAHKKYTSGPVNSDMSTSLQTIDHYIKLPPGLVCTSAVGGFGTGAIGERTSGVLLFFAYSAASTAASQPLIQLSHRIYFEDV